MQVLARYASPAGLQRPALLPPEVFNSPGHGRGIAVARAAYDVLRRRNVRYGHEPWSVDVHVQRIRPPATFLHDKGTCLDLSAAFTAMCEVAQLRPMLAFTPGHALVVIDVSVPLNDAPGEPGAPLAYDRYDGVLRIDVAAEWPRHLIAIDVARAARDAGGEPADFDEACRSGQDHIAAHPGDVKIVDIKLARSRDPKAQALPEPPPEAASPVINTRLPAPPEYVPYPSRADTEQELAAATGHVVIHGPSGLGKSVLAYQRAAAADHGYGWFLTATDKETLTTQLAEAERAERPAGTGTEVFDRTALAAAALARLHGTTAPWVVVLDNANCSPSSIRTLLPRPKPGQTLIVTTTNRDWVRTHDSDALPKGASLRPSWSGGRDVTPINVAGVDAEELIDPRVGRLPDEVTTLVAGSPLIARGLNSALRNGAQLPEITPEGTGASILWHLGRQILRDDESALSLAAFMSWLPSQPQPPALLAQLLTDVESVDDSMRALQRAGLATITSAGSAVMHRLVQGALRAEPPTTSTDPVISLLGSTPGVQVLIRQADSDTLEQMRQHLGTVDATSTSRVGMCWYGLGRVLEYRWSVPASGQQYERALRYEAHLTTEARSACWLGRARVVNQKETPPAEDLELARTWVEQAKDATRNDTSPTARLSFFRARAMEALLVRKEASAIAKSDHSAAKHKYFESLDILQESLDERRAILHEHPELDLDDEDRAIFNFAGNYLGLSKVSTGDEVEMYLKKCEETYTTVIDIRKARYGDIAIPHIASCKAGLMMMFYYAAMQDQPKSEHELDPGRPEWGDRRERQTAALREATRQGFAALNDREQFEGPLDQGDSSKSTAFLAKVMLARRALAPGKDSPRISTNAVVADFFEEVTTARLVEIDS